MPLPFDLKSPTATTLLNTDWAQLPGGTAGKVLDGIDPRAPRLSRNPLQPGLRSLLVLAVAKIETRNTLDL